MLRVGDYTVSMESIRKYIVAISITVLLPLFESIGAGTDSVLKVGYLDDIFGIVRRSPSRYSGQLTVVHCGRPVKIYQVSTPGVPVTKTIFNDKWYKVEAGMHKGYMKVRAISDARPSCFGRKYPKFFDEMGLEMLDYYGWGKLYDYYMYGESKAKI